MVVRHNPGRTGFGFASGRTVNRGASIAVAILALAGVLLFAGVSHSRDAGGDASARPGRNPENTDHQWEDLAAEGTPDAMFALGIRAWQSAAGEADVYAAVGWFQRAADAGHSTAMFNLGVIFWSGERVARHEGQAIRWWRRAAQRGDAAAAFNLGIAYRDGGSFPPKLPAARYWLRTAEQLGHPQAATLLAETEAETPPATPAANTMVTTVPTAAPDRLHRPSITDAADNLAGYTPMTASEAPAGSDPTDPSPSSGAVREQANRIAAPVATPDPAPVAAERDPRSMPPGTLRFQSAAGGTPIHAAPDPASPVIITLTAGVPLRLVSTEGVWARVEVPGGLPLWASERYVELDGANARIRIDNLNARPQPSADPGSPSLGFFPVRAVLPIIGARDGWVRLQAPESIRAWVPANSLAPVIQTDAQWQEAWSEAAGGTG